MAPEVLDGEYGYECDLWSAGIILYVLLCGFPPFFAESDTEIFQLIKKGEFGFEDDAFKQVSD